MYCTDQVHADQKLTYQRPTLPALRHQEARVRTKGCKITLRAKGDAKHLLSA